MEALIAQAIQDTTALRKTSVPWEPDQVHGQSYYAFDTTNIPGTPSHLALKSPMGMRRMPGSQRLHSTAGISTSCCPSPSPE